MATASPISPRLVRAGIVTMDPDTAAVQSIIALQYNPDTLTRSLQIQAVKGGEDGVRVDALRLRGPAVETLKLEAELDAVDQLEFPNQNPAAVQYGLQPQLAQLEMLVNPTVETLEADNNMANADARDHSARAAIDAFCVEPQPRGARSPDRVLDYRGGV